MVRTSGAACGQAQQDRAGGVIHDNRVVTDAVTKTRARSLRGRPAAERASHAA